MAGGCACQRGVYIPHTHPVPCMPPHVDRMTDTCKNITFPQTSFAGCKNYVCNSNKSRKTRLMDSHALQAQNDKCE